VLLLVVRERLEESDEGQTTFVFDCITHKKK
jgi:hypothetical protein